MTLFTDTTPLHVIFAQMGKDLHKVSRFFKGPNQLKLDGSYSYGSQVYDGSNQHVSSCNIDTKLRDATAEELRMADALAECANFVGKYNFVLEQMLSGKIK